MTLRIFSDRCRRERVEGLIFWLHKFRIMHVMWNTGEWKSPLFRIFAPFRPSGSHPAVLGSFWAFFAWCSLDVFLHCFCYLFSGFCFNVFVVIRLYFVLRRCWISVLHLHSHSFASDLFLVHIVVHSVGSRNKNRLWRVHKSRHRRFCLIP